jgi:hypothetical protein
MRKAAVLAISLGVAVSGATGLLTVSSCAAEAAKPFQIGDYVGGGDVAPAARPFQAGDYVGGGVAPPDKPFEIGDFEGGGQLDAQKASAQTESRRVDELALVPDFSDFGAQDLTAVINDDPRPVRFRGPIHEINAPLVAQGE